MSVAIPGHETAFEQDVVAYLDALPKLLGNSEGKFALVGRGMVATIYELRDEAMAAGYRLFGLDGFLVQRISKQDLEMGMHWQQ